MGWEGASWAAASCPPLAPRLADSLESPSFQFLLLPLDTLQAIVGHCEILSVIAQVWRL